jgi:hypothetical protein
MKNRKVSSTEFFLRRKLANEAKRAFGKKSLKNLSWLEALPRDAEWWRRWDTIDALINLELSNEKKWHRDGDKKVTPIENGIPGHSKRKEYKFEYIAAEDEEADDWERDEKEKLEHEKFLEDVAYALDEIDDTLKMGKFEENFFDMDEADANDERPGDRGAENLHPYLPKRAIPATHVLMRRYPRHLKESIARDMANFYKLLFEEKRLLPALCFFEVGIEDEETFNHVKLDVFGGRTAGKRFTFLQYKKDLRKIFRLIKAEKEKFFLHNRFLLRAAAHISKEPEKQLTSLWARFEAAKKSLTVKQWNAFKQVKVKKREQTSVAKDMRISIDSLRDRLEGAELKFRRALPELASFTPSKSHRKSAKNSYIYSGLLDKRAAARVLPLFRVNPKTGEKKQIPIRKGKNPERPNVDKAFIKAWANDSTPVPDLSFTDYFTRLLPEGTLDRMSREGEDAVHDLSSGVHTFESKTRNRDHYHPKHDHKNKDE